MRNDGTEDVYRDSAELVRRAQAGSHEALEELFARYYERVHVIASARLGPELRRELDSFDIVQNAFVDAVKQFDGFTLHNEASLIRWLGTIVENKVRDANRRATRQKGDRRREVPLEGVVPGSESSFAAPRGPIDARRPVDVAEDREWREWVITVIAALPEDERELVLLRDYEGRDWLTIAEMTSRPSADAARVAYRKVIVGVANTLRKSFSAEGGR